MADQPETWEVTLDVDGARRVERVTIAPPFGIRRADAEVKAIRRAEAESGWATRALDARLIDEGFCCRHCSECDGVEHHWLHGEVDYEPETGAPIGEYGCKHCEAVGAPCEACGADPELDTPDEIRPCSVCHMSGIVVVGVRRG